MRLRDRLVAAWYAPSPTPLARTLVPLSWLYGAVIALRRALYRAGALRSERLPVAVVVVGNLTLGGTGKTPLALALAESLAVRGLHPGVVSRGYGGRHAARDGRPREVIGDDDALEVGDEPLLFASAGFPVVIGRDRARAAARLLAAHPSLDVVIADDGLQHYRLARDCEIVVVDGARGFGNRHLLPAGPLREPTSRLGEATLAVITQASDEAVPIPESLPHDLPTFVQRLVPGRALHQVADPGTVEPVTAFAGEGGIHAIAGSGHPERFFETLARLGIHATPHAFADHHAFVPGDLSLPQARKIVMTAKDAVKCRAFADARCWYLPVRSEIDAALTDRVEKTIRGPEAP